jgi:hypothetical protein
MPMTLGISVGQLAFLRIHEPEEVEGFREELRAVNRVLTSNGFPNHNEPESLAQIVDRVPIGSIPYGWLHYTRRAVAYAMRPGKRFRPLRAGEEPSEDSVYDEVLFSCESHIICHSDCQGFYVPIDFPEPLYDDLPDSDPGVTRGGILGSSQGGLRELLLAAPLLDIPLRGGRLSDKAARAICQEVEGAHPHWVARQTWLCVFERLRQSVEHGATAVFG